MADCTSTGTTSPFFLVLNDSTISNTWDCGVAIPGASDNAFL